MKNQVAYPFPSGRFYDREHHTWTLPERDSAWVTVGMDALGLETLGDLAYIALEPVGTSVGRGLPMGTLEAAKMTGEIVSPIGGVLIARNEGALEDPSLVNRDPYGAGWLVRIEPGAWEADAGALVSGTAVDGWVEEELRRYREQGWL